MWFNRSYNTSRPYYDVDREHSTKYTKSHCLMKIREHSECHRNGRIFNTNRWRARKITVHELTRAPYVTSTSRLCSDNLNTMPPRCHCKENQLNIFSNDKYAISRVQHDDGTTYVVDITNSTTLREVVKVFCEVLWFEFV